VAEGRFRNDLLYRLQVVTLNIPPLRDRSDDIRPLAEHFLAAACADHGRHIESVDPACYEKLSRHDWPGNVRELANVIESAVIMAENPRLSAADINLGGKGDAAVAESGALKLAEIEKRAILEALIRHRGSRTIAADELGVSTRTIQRKIKEYDLPY
jgi:Nif-specific regulatory protein